MSRMEDILDVYKRPYDAKRPLVCLDESSKQHTREVRPSLPLEPGKAEKLDTEYERNGVSHLFMIFSPLEGKRRVEVTDNHAGVEWARQIKKLVDVDYPNAEKIVLVMDNLSTHTTGSLYKAFEPPEARRLAERLEIHFTPKHGSWLDMAEIELSVLSRQCLSRRIPDQETLRREVDAWTETRNSAGTTMNWRFTTEDARIKLKKLYPTIKLN